MSKGKHVITKVVRLEDETAALRPQAKPKAADAFGDASKGGNQQYNWNLVKDLSYKDRECFLGYTTKIGVLDKGGKWKKRDWWTTLSGEDGPSPEEIKKVKEEDERRIRIGLGLEVDTKNVEMPTMDAEKVKEMTKQMKEQAAAEQQEDPDRAEFTYGLGFKPTAADKIKIAPGAVNNITTAFALDAVGVEEVIPGLERKPRQINKEERESSSESTEKHRKPRSRSRDGKHKKDKKKKRSSSSSSRSTSSDRRDKAEKKKAKKEMKKAEKKAKKLELELKKRYGL